ncbi:MAG TPA: DUF742 domain-containing protein [Pseudonocardiaceae bacterium]|nr:DUF742 domain-containing protein [Pseudonocardiaceae bacterium]
MRHEDEDAPRLPDPRMIPVAQPPGWFEEAPPASEPDDEPVADDGVFVRPFIVTRGRTRPLHDGLRIETLIRATPAALSAPLRFERRRIVELAQQPVSLAEVAAKLGVPLGVATVLVADLYAGRYLTLHEPTELPVHVIERIRDLVRAL